MEEVVSALLEQLAQANATIVELSKIIAEQKPALPAPPAMEQVLPFPLQVTESEEDAYAAFNAGEITREQLQEALREIEFFNHEITVPTGGT